MYLRTHKYHEFIRQQTDSRTAGPESQTEQQTNKQKNTHARSEMDLAVLELPDFGALLLQLDGQAIGLALVLFVGACLVREPARSIVCMSVSSVCWGRSRVHE